MDTPAPRGFFINTSNGKRWEVVSDNVYGLSIPHPAIFVDTRPRNRELLDSWLHEGIHTERQDFSEADTVKLARFLAELLWNAGYRQVPKRKPRSKRAPRIKGVQGSH